MSTTLDATGEVLSGGQLNLIPQGTAQSERVGRLVVVKSILFHGILTYAPGAAANAADGIFMYVVLDRQANKAVAAVADVFTSTDLSVALPNLDNERRFKILKRVFVPFNPGAGVTTAYNYTVRLLDYYVKCNIPLEFDNSATTGAIGTITSNNIFVIGGSKNSDDLIGIQGTHRVRYTDS